MNDRRQNVGVAPTGASAGPDETAITLGVLTAIESNAEHSQRSLAGELGIALGLTNAYLKRCVKKGWVKVQHVPANRYAYYLTPVGFAEKARLTAEYLTYSFGFFRDARGQSETLLRDIAERGWRRIALIGASELAEIAALSAADTPVEVAGIVDGARAPGRLAGLPVVADLAALGRVDAVMITDLGGAQARFDEWNAHWGRERVLALPMLRLSPNGEKTP